MIIMLVPREKNRKLACVPNGTEMLSIKATTNKNMPSPTLSKKQLIIKTEYLICDRSNYSVKIFTAHSTTV